MVQKKIQDMNLGTKQLVFFFMAATIIAVVVFLCGVLVGRGVPVRQSSESVPGLDLGVNSALTATNRDQSTVEPLDQIDPDQELTYHQRLENDDPIVETLLGNSSNDLESSNDQHDDFTNADQRSSLNGEALLDTDSQISARETDRLSSDTRRNISNEPVTAEVLAGSGYTVQVAALRVDEAAQQIADRLVEKGFPAYVLLPAEDAPVSVYRVRVGRYAERSDAERMFERLVREEKFKPWITR